MGDQKGTGFTLLELLVAVALASLVLVSLSFITQTMFTAKRDMESYDAERDMFRAEYLVRSALSTAVDVRKVDSAQTGGRGWVDTSFAVPDGADIQPVAVFRREIRAFPLPPTVPGATGDTTSLHVNSGIFYIPPRFADGVYTSGVLFVNFGSEANPTAPVSPSYANEVVGNLVRFETSKPQFIPAADNPDNLDILKGFEVELIFRRFVNQSMVRPKCFLSTAGACPYSPDDNDDTNDTELYRDVRRIIKVLLLNADAGPSPFANKAQTRERTLGRIYFFRMLSPTIGAISD